MLRICYTQIVCLCIAIDYQGIIIYAKSIDLNCCPLAFIGNCSTFVVACANEPSNVERWEHRTINKVPKRGKIPSTTAL
ncbi:hypothetical protein DW988_17855 [Bacteroides uniformis]|uniref:Uncharacterized protein n=1 Tax=Bacteroides uniformis TaxID=820 RepID=A0A413N9K7_BACUN|nr:hypothetical protein DW988_17855 [Bacteroides uniformis]